MVIDGYVVGWVMNCEQGFVLSDCNLDVVVLNMFLDRVLKVSWLVIFICVFFGNGICIGIDWDLDGEMDFSDSN